MKNIVNMILERNMQRFLGNLVKNRYARALSYTCTRPNFFDGKRILKPPVEAPSNKGETTTNPADMIKRNDILMFSQKPVNYIESVKKDGFHLANNLLIRSPDADGNIIGAVMIDTESYEVNLSKPDKGFTITNGFLVELKEDVLQVFEKVHPKPEICVIGLGKKSRMLHDKSRKYLSNLGIQLEITDSNNAAQVYDLLATERPHVIGAFLLPPNV